MNDGGGHASTRRAHDVELTVMCRPLVRPVDDRRFAFAETLLVDMDDVFHRPYRHGPAAPRNRLDAAAGPHEHAATPRCSVA
jgi:hypothetical protein